MDSDMSNSASEGEIIEHREISKLQYRNSSREGTVDAPSRQFTPVSASSHTSARCHDSRRSRSRSRSPFYHRRDRSRSRSPYRHPTSPRGAKRQHDYHDDNRRQRPRNDHDQSNYRARVSYEELDHNGPPSGPPLHGGAYQTNYGRVNQSYSQRGYRQDRGSTQSKHNRHDQSGHAPGKDLRAGAGFDGRRNQYTSQNWQNKFQRSSGDSERNEAPPQNGFTTKLAGYTPANQNTVEAPQNVAPALVAPADVPEPDYTQPAVDDEASIQKMREEKARRRAEIRARAQKEAEKQPLLQQVLDHNSADRNTPNIPTPAGQIEHSASPQTSSPNVSLLESAPNSAPDSPGVFVTQKEVTSDNRPLGEEEGNSAAHYDPMKDMLEDQRRAALKQGLGQVTASSYKETLTEQRTVLLPVSEKAEAAPHKKPKKEFDMFADEDDEEEEEEEEGQDEHEMDVDGDEKTTKAVAIPQGRQYHESLLDKWDDEDGYLKIIPGEILEDGRYTIVEVLGRGVFAVVVRATDSATKEQVAIKIVRKNDSMRKAGLKEIYFLKKILEDDPRNKNHIVRFKTSFDHKGHLCMVFENLKQNLRDLVKSLGGHGISLVAVKEYAKQMFIALAALKRLDIIHADLKPDNILTADDNRHIKICDLGSAADRRDNNDVTTYLVSRFYRAPEIILGMKYDFAIDIWAIGCTLFELWTGKILFQGPNNNQMLKAIMECRGKFSGKLLRKASLAGYYFNEHEQFASRELDPFGKETTRWMIFKKPTKDLKTRVQEGAKNTQNINQTELVLFADLLDKCLNINPEKRITPEEALRHPFVNPRAAAAGHGHGHGPNGPGGGGGGGGPSKYKPYAK